MRRLSVIACHECDLLQREILLPPGATARCRRCGGVLYRNKPDSLDRTLALTVGGAALFLLANLFPVVGLEASGNRTMTTLFGTVRVLHDQGMTSVGVLVFVTTILMPALEISAMLYMLLPLRLGWVPKGLPAMYRLVHTVRPWGMVEVFMLGTLVSLAKLAHIAAVLPGVGLWSFGALMFVLAASAASFEPHDFWAQVEEAGRRRECAHAASPVMEAAR
jgi:paraquat-inducible protein A